MEGISGIVNTYQTNSGEPLYEEGRRLYTQEINAAVRGAKAAGATEVVVLDRHGAGREANDLLGDSLTTVQVKQGLAVKSARMLSPKRARELVEAGARKALSNLKAVEPYDPGKPCEIKVEYKWTKPPSKLRHRS